MREYGKLHTRFFLDPDVQKLSIDAAYLLLYLIEGPQSSALGCIHCPTGFITACLNWKEDRVEKCLKELARRKFIKRDKRRGWVFIRNFLKWNGTEHKYALKKIGTLFMQVPREVSFMPDLCNSIVENLSTDHFGDAISIRLKSHPNPTVTSRILPGSISTQREREIDPSEGGSPPPALDGRSAPAQEKKADNPESRDCPEHLRGDLSKALKTKEKAT